MSTTTIKKRRIALVVPIVSALSLFLAACSTNLWASDAYPKTSQFVFEKFNEGKFLDTFKPNQPEVGITLEAMAQLSALGYDKTKQAKAVAWTKAHTDQLDSIGLKANYVFTAHALGFSADPTVRQEAKAILSGISPDGVLEGSNNFVYSWVIFSLLSEGENSLANKVALHLSSLSETDGGYKYVQGTLKETAAADVTAFAILSMKASLGTGNSSDEAAKEFAISKAKTWLTSNLTDGDHWNSWGDVDVSGTSYAIMALSALGLDVSDQLTWLKSRISKTDNGIFAPWTEPTGDTFTSAQALLALNKLTFIDILKHKVD